MIQLSRLYDCTLAFGGKLPPWYRPKIDRQHKSHWGRTTKIVHWQSLTTVETVEAKIVAVKAKCAAGYDPSRRHAIPASLVRIRVANVPKHHSDKGNQYQKSRNPSAIVWSCARLPEEASKIMLVRHSPRSNLLPSSLSHHLLFWNHSRRLAY